MLAFGLDISRNPSKNITNAKKRTKAKSHGHSQRKKYKKKTLKIVKNIENVKTKNEKKYCTNFKYFRTCLLIDGNILYKNYYMFKCYINLIVWYIQIVVSAKSFIIIYFLVVYLEQSIRIVKGKM